MKWYISVEYRDYEPGPYIVSIHSGVFILKVRIIDDDLHESNETFKLTIKRPRHNNVKIDGKRCTTTVIIIDNEERK